MDIKEIAKIIDENGGRIYYVGGCVRDRLMNLPANDIDCCLVGMTSEKFKALFPSAFQRGNFFSVFDLDGYEIALARREIKTSNGHKGFITDIDNVSLEEDLIRRDITINSIAQDIITGAIIDPFNGSADINNRIIRATSKHFIEDPLRVYRVAQFAARFEFNVEENTIKIMRNMKDELKSLSVERVFCELKKSLSSKKPSIFFGILSEINLLDVHFKEIADLAGVIQPKEYHPEGDVYTHSMIVLDEVSKLTDDIKIRWAALTHDLGKEITPLEILPHHYNHDINGIELVKNICNRLKLPNDWEKTAIVVAREHMRAGLFGKMNVSSKVSFLEKNKNYLNALEIVAKVDSHNKNIDFVNLSEQMHSEVNGNKFMLPNNRNAKEILHEKRIKWLKNIQN